MDLARTLATLLVLLLATGAFADDPIPYDEFLQQNNENSAKLSLGMTKAEVMSVMGHKRTKVRDGPLSNPWKVEAYIRGEDTFEVLYYLVRKHPPFSPILESQAITAVIKNGGLVAWGRDADKPFR